RSPRPSGRASTGYRLVHGSWRTLGGLKRSCKQKAAHFWAAPKFTNHSSTAPWPSSLKSLHRSDLPFGAGRSLVVVLVGDLVLVGLDQLGQFFAGHFLVGDVALVGEEIDDLVLEDRSAQTGKSLRVLAVVVVNLLFLAGEAAHF